MKTLLAWPIPPTNYYVTAPEKCVGIIPLFYFDVLDVILSANPRPDLQKIRATLSSLRVSSKVTNRSMVLSLRANVENLIESGLIYDKSQF